MSTTLAAGLPVHFVDDAQSLARAVDACRAVPFVALDSEFMRVRTFYAQAALFQLCDSRACYLVDPLAIADLSPLAALLADPSVTKIMHSCSEDLEVCDRRLGTLPEPLFDTQVMAAFAGLGFSVGYQRVLADVLGVALEKTETRTDWLQRPLSTAQVAYAAEDVAHLPALHEQLAQRLASVPLRAAWAAEECSAILARHRARDGADYRAIGGAWRLDPRGLGVLRALHAWRERTARERDLPRSWVVPDGVLLRIADLQPSTPGGLARIDEFAPGAQRRFGPAMLAEMTLALEIPENELPVRVPAPPGPAETRRLKQLREKVTSQAERLGIAPELLVRRREMEELLRCADAGEDPASLAPMQGWRRATIGEMLWLAATGAA